MNITKYFKKKFNKLYLKINSKFKNKICIYNNNYKQITIKIKQQNKKKKKKNSNNKKKMI